MLLDDRIWMGQGEDRVCLLLAQANRHGLVAGASGTGKTVTMKVMAEGFSAAGVPVFMADVKGDVTGMCEPGVDNEGMQKRIAKFGIEGWEYRACPCRFWDVLPGRGCPVRVTVSDMGPELLSRLLGLTDAQRGVLDIVFRIADERQMLLIDLKDLRAMLGYVSDHASEFAGTYGSVPAQSVGTILRELIAVEDQGGDVFFGEPALDLTDFLTRAPDGRGYVNVLNAAQLIHSPQIYAMFLLWMLSDLFETLPEVGDLDRPKLVFFFDEAHLLFDDMPKELIDKIVQVVKLIRSKGVGVYFVTQSPGDIPDEVLSQLSNRIQHGLRAYTPAEQKVVRAAAQAFRENPAFSAADVLLELGTGEALVSFLDEEGRPTIVERAAILPPQCLMAQASDGAIAAALAAQSDLVGKYGTSLDRQSAFEIIADGKARDEQQAAADAAAAEEQAQRALTEKQEAAAQAKAQKAAERDALAQARKEEKEVQRADAAAQRKAQKTADMVQKTATSIIGQIGREASRQIMRGLFGGRQR